MTEKNVIDLKHPEEQVPKERPYDSHVLLEWEADEYEFRPKGNKWFRNVGIAALVLFIFALVTQNWFFAILVAVATFVVFLYAVRPPKRVYCAITVEGIRIGRRVFDFHDLRSFWIFYSPYGAKEASIESKKTVMPYIRMPLGEIDPVAVRDQLLRFIKEEQHEESLADIIAHYFGF
jgi:hypothetical protein